MEDSGSQFCPKITQIRPKSGLTWTKNGPNFLLNFKTRALQESGCNTPKEFPDFPGRCVPGYTIWSPPFMYIYIIRINMCVFMCVCVLHVFILTNTHIPSIGVPECTYMCVMYTFQLGASGVTVGWFPWLRCLASAVHSLAHRQPPYRLQLRNAPGRRHIDPRRQRQPLQRVPAEVGGPVCLHAVRPTPDMPQLWWHTKNGPKNGGKRGTFFWKFWELKREPIGRSKNM